MIIKERVILSEHTTFRVGGPAKFWLEAMSVAEVKEALNFAKQRQLPFLLLADGSNIIAADAGFNGVVIKLQDYSWSIDGSTIQAAASVAMSELVRESAQKGLGGLEWAGGLPGSFGGAIRGNAGAFGGEIKDNLALVTALNPATGEVIELNNERCQFGYRDSIFKHNNFIILAARLNLKPAQNPAELEKVANEHIQYRRDRHPLEYPNAGSIFKNVPVEKLSSELQTHYSKSIKTDPFPVIPAARLIADAGLSGLKIGQAQISTKHTNYIVNLGDAKASDIVALIEKVRVTIWGKLGVELEIEPQLVGF